MSTRSNLTICATKWLDCGIGGNQLVTLDSKHTPNRKETIDVTVTLPDDALATEVVNIDLAIAPTSGGEPYDEVTLSVSVAAVHI